MLETEFDPFLKRASAYMPKARTYAEKLGIERIYLSFAYHSQCRYCWRRIGDRVVLRDLEADLEEEMKPRGA
jgi:hypothetical protein